MLDAEGHCIRRKLIRVSQESCRDECHIRRPDCLRGERSEDDVADALTAGPFIGSLAVIVRCATAVFRLLLLVPPTAIPEEVHPKSREYKHGDDGHEQAGAEESQGGRR